MIGQRLGPYEITAKLGEGGMGEVYRATDTRLDRQVAIKVLPAEFTADKERLARFEREAKLLAQLHHPNIASIFGLEESAGVRALVMELVPGPTLDERLAAGAFSIAESLSTALQIAQALEEAHDKGIVHRDLKPQNVKASSEGKVKVLDFGLAKAMTDAGGAAASAADLARSPTILNSPTLTAVHGTQLGVILGTAAYMAPEQARGAAVDKRADIWAFGVVLYEMLTGASLFAADTVSDTLAGVLKTEIDLARLPEATPAAIRQLLRRCLERNPKNRLHDIADARIIVEEVLAGRFDEPAAASEAIVSRSPSTWRIHAMWLTALIAVSAGVAIFSRSEVDRALAPTVPNRLAIQLPPEQTIAVGGNSLLSFAPDGESLVFGGTVDGRRMILRRKLAERHATPIAGTEDAEAPFHSPDGSWLGFVARGALMKVPIAGGVPIRLGEAHGAGGATWLPDGSIVVAPIYSDGLFRLASEGSAPDRLTTPDRAAGVLGHWWPELVPGTRWVLFTAFRTPVDKSRVGMVHLETREVRWLVDGGFFGRFVPTGHLLFVRGQRLYAQPFDPAEGKVSGVATPVVDDLAVEQTGGFAMLAVSRRGTLAYVAESLAHPARELVWLDRAGRPSPATGERRRYLSVSLAPDGRRVALTVHGSSRDLWIHSFDRGTLSRLTSGDDTEFDPAWTPDGQELIYVLDRPPFELHRIGAGEPDRGRPLWPEAAEHDTVAAAISPDGRTVAYSLTEEQSGSNIYARALDGAAPPRQVRAGRGAENFPAFSPDGKWLGYEADDTGRLEIYVEPFPGPGERFQVSADGGREPRWARNGELFFRRGNDMRSAVTQTGERFEFEAPRTLFTYPILPYSSGGVSSHSYDVTADGQRVVAIVVPEGSQPRQIEIVTDWTAELVRLTPTAD